MEIPLCDKLDRRMRDLRISVTDRCNFRCTYCMPKSIFGDDYDFIPRQELLSYEEITRFVRLFASLGVKKIRLTGGEPLLRPDLHDLIEQLAAVDGVEDVALTTNGLLLRRYGKKLFEAGLRRLNISLDALNRDIFGRMNGRGIDPARIVDNIDFAEQLGFEVKVNMVVQKGVNDSEIVPMAAYFKERNVTLRLIEFMDAGNDNGWSCEKVVTKREMLQLLGQAYELEPEEQTRAGEVAQYYRYNQSESRIGFITSISEPFCSACTRLRLSSDGKLYTCLFASNGFDLRSPSRGGATDLELLETIKNIWSRRTDRYSDERTDYAANERKKIGMSYIGG